MQLQSPETLHLKPIRLMILEISIYEANRKRFENWSSFKLCHTEFKIPFIKI